MSSPPPPPRYSRLIRRFLISRVALKWGGMCGGGGHAFFASFFDTGPKNKSQHLTSILLFLCLSLSVCPTNVKKTPEGASETLVSRRRAPFSSHDAKPGPLRFVSLIRNCSGMTATDRPPVRLSGRRAEGRREGGKEGGRTPTTIKMALALFMRM